MLKIFGGIGVFILPSSAIAGCAEYLENSSKAPVAEICYQDVCDMTTLEYVCSNVFEYRAEYAVGWSIRCTLRDDNNGSDCQYFWQGRPIDPAKNDFITINGEKISP